MLEVGQTLQQGRYRIKEQLSQGEIDVVYLATDNNQPDHIVVIKENLDIAPETQEQFQQEAAMLVRLSHPNLPGVKVHFSEPSGRQYLVMDYIEAENLRDYAHGQPLAEAEVLTWIGQVMDALEFMHTWTDPATGQPRPIIHRDVKPSNIKRTRDGQIVLVDLGWAQCHTDASTQSAARAVTTGYSPPEQYTGKADVRSDIYALGATLYALLTGKEPLDAHAIAGGKPLPPLRQYNPHITSDTEQVILRAMHVQARNRFPSIQAMRAALYNRRLPPFARQPTQPQIAPLPSTDVVVAGPLPSPLRWLPTNFWIRIVSFAAIIGFAGLLYSGLGRDLVQNISPAQSTAIPPTATFPPSLPTPTLDVAKWGGLPPPAPITGTLWTDPNYDFTFVYVPEGVFRIGSAEGDPDEQPLHMITHMITIDSFWIMQTEVTNAQYARCVAAEQCGAPANAIWNQPDYAQYPVTHVSWYQAVRYATWVGGRLPSEAEWEKAARGPDSRIYPWGNEWNGLWLNYCDKQCERSWNDLQFDDGFNQTAPVGSYPKESASPYQVFDLAGNAREWTSSLERDYPYNPSDGRENWESNAPRIVRGGSWRDRQDDVRAANRFSVQPTYQGEEVGFRIVRSS